MAEYSELIEMLRVLDGTCKNESITWVAQESADAMEKMQAQNNTLIEKVAALKKRVAELENAAAWDEDYRRGQVQGMW